MAVAALVMGATLTVLGTVVPAEAFAQERFDNGWHRDYRGPEYREHFRHEERVRAWREHERRELRRDYRHHHYYWR